MSGFDGRTCVVTGGARGLGRAIAERFLADGARVAVLDVDAATVAAAADELGDAALGIQCDVSDRNSVERAAAAVFDEFASVDVLVNNAGINPIGPSESFSVDEWDRTLAVNTTGVFHCSQVYGRQMIEAGAGAIVNIASINARSSWPRRLAYCASKAAVVSMTEVLAVEWAPHGVRVNAIGPGVIKTDLVARAIEEGSSREDLYLQGTPVGRLGRPNEVANAVAFLADPELSGFTTGSFFVVDGGWMANGWVDE
ncbi:MAG: family oxidoreductase [Frankiales bacterium]|nr:family oxidoreductase [Frankiales bacterium]